MLSEYYRQIAETVASAIATCVQAGDDETVIFLRREILELSGATSPRTTAGTPSHSTSLPGQMTEVIYTI